MGNVVKGVNATNQSTYAHFYGSWLSGQSGGSVSPNRWQNAEFFFGGVWRCGCRAGMAWRVFPCLGKGGSELGGVVFPSRLIHSGLRVDS